LRPKSSISILVVSVICSLNEPLPSSATSLSPPSLLYRERPVAELVAAAARRFGLAAMLVGKEPERPNVVVRVGPAGEPALLLRYDSQIRDPTILAQIDARRLAA
jgi:hypothetical protein